MKNVRGWIGLGVLALGLILYFIETTKPVSWLILGFGLGMMSTGFKNGK